MDVHVLSDEQIAATEALAKFRVPTTGIEAELDEKFSKITLNLITTIRHYQQQLADRDRQIAELTGRLEHIQSVVGGNSFPVNQDFCCNGFVRCQAWCGVCKP